MNIYEETFTVRVRDVDTNNKLTSFGILNFMQEAAGSDSARVGFGLNDISKTHLSWVILDWKIKIFSTPCWNSKVTVRTWPRKADKIHSYRDFEMFDSLGNKVAIATSKWILIDTLTSSISRITDDVKKAYSLTEHAVFDCEPNKLLEPDSYDLKKDYTILRRDIDINNHVNNMYYLTYAYEALPENVFNSTSFSNIEILYKKQCKLGDEVVFLYSKVDNSHVVTIKSKDLSTLHSIIKLY